MLWIDVVYTVSDGKRKEFLQKVKENQIIESSRKEEGNVRYDCSLPIDRPNEVWLTEIWTDAESQKAHGQTEHYKKLSLLKTQYVLAVKIARYQVSKI